MRRGRFCRYGGVWQKSSEISGDIPWTSEWDTRQRYIQISIWKTEPVWTFVMSDKLDIGRKKQSRNSCNRRKNDLWEWKRQASGISCCQRICSWKSAYIRRNLRWEKDERDNCCPRTAWFDWCERWHCNSWRYELSEENCRKDNWQKSRLHDRIKAKSACIVQQCRGLFQRIFCWYSFKNNNRERAWKNWKKKVSAFNGFIMAGTKRWMEWTEYTAAHV